MLHCVVFMADFRHQQKLNIRWSSSKVPNTALRQKECLFVHGLHYTCSLAKQIVMTDELLAVSQFL
jgi:hypothetical protein